MPPIEHIVEGISKVTGEVIVEHGILSANLMEISTQLPMRSVFYTSGKSRFLENVGIELIHAKNWQLQQGQLGHVVRALEWVGKHNIHASLKTILSRVSSSDIE